MSINQFPVSLTVARGIRAHMLKVRPKSHFTIVGKGDRRYVRETHPDGYIEMHGRVNGYGKVQPSSNRQNRSRQ